MIYLDNSATTQVDEDVARAAFEAMTVNYGNPSSPYMLGRDALTLLTQARHQVAQVIGAPTRRLFFTSGGTEANNLAVRGSLLDVYKRQVLLLIQNLIKLAKKEPLHTCTINLLTEVKALIILGILIAAYLICKWTDLFLSLIHIFLLLYRKIHENQSLIFC